MRVHIHPDNPQARLIAQVIEALNQGQLIGYPTDSGYAFGWTLGSTQAAERVRRLRRLDARHPFTLCCADLKQVGSFTRLHDSAFRLIKRLTPGPYTFLLAAGANVPRRLQAERRRTVGIRLPDHAIAQALVSALGEPLCTSTLLLPDDELIGLESEELAELLGQRVDLFVDGGACPSEPTTVVDLSADDPVVLRRGAGEVDWE